MVTNGREPSLGELDEKLDELKADLTTFASTYLPRELYEARHQAMRDNLALQLSSLETAVKEMGARVDTRLDSIERLAKAADTKATWAMRLVVSATITVLIAAAVGLLVSSGAGAP